MKSISFLPSARQLYRMENLYLLEHPVNGDVLSYKERRLKAIFLMHISFVTSVQTGASKTFKIIYQNSVLSS